MRLWKCVPMITLLLLLAACGGGDGGDGASQTASPLPPLARPELPVVFTSTFPSGPAVTVRREASARQLVWDLLRQTEKPVVLDADGINALAEIPLVAVLLPGRQGRPGEVRLHRLDGAGKSSTPSSAWASPGTSPRIPNSPPPWTSSTPAQMLSGTPRYTSPQPDRTAAEAVR